MDFSLASVVPQRVSTPAQARAEVAGRGGKRRFNGTTERLVAHNDGFGFGDFGPDYLFLWCGRPDAAGEGASFLVDGLRLLELLAGSRSGTTPSSHRSRVRHRTPSRHRRP